MTHHDQENLVLAIELTPDQLDLLAHRVADLLRDGRDDGLIGVDGAARYLSCSRGAIYHAVERNRLRVHRFGGRLLFDPGELREDVERGQ